ncbi:DNA modification methylase [Sporomusaceae bacterium BoRhaA]|uniref:DNA-methyltransferase n=1 Tax=Pelorhabdus rhamnosifermentans TaxID=2772457 RepID=UPI001C06358A|nr:site-specific DNA-methyltransferase [Pelorhabdus rhamnosifermentans]MBU2704131.1 DNA modification methylase [Pelorhabdus rhamnosifermentans]
MKTIDIQIINDDCIRALRRLSAKSIHCCVTSPPYWGLRDYGVVGQMGLEETPEEYIAKMVQAFREVWRVLRDDGTLWLNLGDSYATGTKAERQQSKNPGVGANNLAAQNSVRRIGTPKGLKTKDLVGIPWMVAFALRADGWYLRSDIIWAKSNPMPESVTDRPTKAHEYIFLLSKSANYYYDAEAIAEPVTKSTVKRLNQDVEHQIGSARVLDKTNGNMKAVAPRFGGNKYTRDPDAFYRTKSGNIYEYHDKRNKRTVWTVATKPYKEAHFATYPPELIEPCILAGCPVGGIVLDPFVGSGTTLEVAAKLGRNSVGIELNPDYINLIEKRVKPYREQGILFA